MIRTSIRMLNDGVIKYDGGTIFGQVPKAVWEKNVPVDRKNRITMGLNCLLIQCGNRNILIDTGVGSKDMNGKRELYGLQPSKLSKELKDLGLTPRDIDTVILTNLCFDHVGGCSRMDRAGNLVPTFPKAKFYVQREAWEEALNPNERCRDSYASEDLDALLDTEQLVLLDGDTEVFPGIHCRKAAGPTQGHQIVTITHGGERVVCLGDIIPTPYHLEPACISSTDRHPESTLETKRELIERSIKDGWLLIFYHGWDTRAGYLEKRDGRVALRPVEL